jgi:polyisoprenoid-binding protein YceI
MRIVPALTLGAALALALAAGAPLAAAPASYALEKEKSSVAFAWDFGQDEVTGRMPVARADLVIDFQDVGASRVDVAVDVAHAEAGFPFATQAMKGPKVLDAGRFPEISFRSTRVRRDGEGALIDGDITIRGVTRPTTLSAQFYRQQGSAEGDLSHLSILLTGAVSRAAFGAGGWGDMAGDEVRLQILARIARTD